MDKCKHEKIVWNDYLKAAYCHTTEACKYFLSASEIFEQWQARGERIEKLEEEVKTQKMMNYLASKEIIKLKKLLTYLLNDPSTTSVNREAISEVLQDNEVKDDG